jgi:hypothetical protein
MNSVLMLSYLKVSKILLKNGGTIKGIIIDSDDFLYTVMHIKNYSDENIKVHIPKTEIERIYNS